MVYGVEWPDRHLEYGRPSASRRVALCRRRTTREARRPHQAHWRTSGPGPVYDDDSMRMRLPQAAAGSSPDDPTRTDSAHEGAEDDAE